MDALAYLANGDSEQAMTRQDLLFASIDTLKSLLSERLPQGTPVYLFGSRARGEARWNSDFDLWIDTDLMPNVRLALLESIDESLIPFKVDIVSTAQLKESFGEQVRKEAQRWM